MTRHLTDRSILTPQRVQYIVTLADEMSMLVINHHANVVEIASKVADRKKLNQILSDLFIGLLCDSYCQDNYFLGENANDVLSLFTQEKEAEAISTPISAHVQKMWLIMHPETDDSDEESESVGIGMFSMVLLKIQLLYINSQFNSVELFDRLIYFYSQYIVDVLLVKDFRKIIIPFFDTVFNKPASAWKDIRSDDIRFNVHQDLDFLSCLRGTKYKDSGSSEGKKGWYALLSFGLLVKPFPTAFKTRFEGLTKHLEFNDEYQDRQTMPLTFNQCIKAMLLCDSIPKITYSSKDKGKKALSVQPGHCWNFFHIGDFVLPIDQNAHDEICLRHKPKDVDSSADEGVTQTLKKNMKPSQAFQLITECFKFTSPANKKVMFSNCIAELMIATNETDEQDQMPSSIQTKLFAALQNITAQSVDNTRYSFDTTRETNRKRHHSPAREFFDDDPFNIPDNKKTKL